MKAKVIKIESEGVEFDNGYKLYSDHQQDCCEHHYLSFDDLTLKDFEGLEFDLSGDRFFKGIEGYGIELLPLNGHPVRVPGYGSNNGYYSNELTLLVYKENDIKKEYDITECQEESEY